MYSDEIMHIDPNQTLLQISGERSVNPNPKTVQSSGKQTDRLDFGSAYQKFIDLAMENENRRDLNAVGEARKLMESGDLDSIESARLAAKAILRFGI
jgi:hypothetical protein